MAQYTNTLLLDIGLGKLAIGRVLMAMAAKGKGNFAKAEKQLNEAVDGLRKAGAQHHIARGLLVGGVLQAEAEVWKSMGGGDKQSLSSVKGVILLRKGYEGRGKVRMCERIKKWNFSNLRVPRRTL